MTMITSPLLSNAVDAIQLGTEDYQSTDPKRYLSAVRNIAAGVLLMFKEKLRKLCPADSDEVLLKVRIRPVLKKDGSLSFVGEGPKTVDVQQIKDRFASLNVHVEWKRFDALVKVRNDLEHYYSTASAKNVREALADAFAVLRAFITNELELEPVDLLGESTWNILLTEASIFAEELKRCKELLRTIKWPTSTFELVAEELRCMNCNSELLKPANSSSKIAQLEVLCTACGTNASYEELAEHAIDTVFFSEMYLSYTKGGEPPLCACNVCDKTTFHVESNQCLLCMSTLEYISCSFCGEGLTPDEQDFNGLCGHCRWKVEKDD